MKYIIMCRNNGMWCGMETPLKNNGTIITFDNKEDAEKKLKEINDKQCYINNFNSYFIEERGGIK